MTVSKEEFVRILGEVPPEQSALIIGSRNRRRGEIYSELEFYDVSPEGKDHEPDFLWDYLIKTREWKTVVLIIRYSENETRTLRGLLYAAHQMGFEESFNNLLLGIVDRMALVGITGLDFE